MKKIRLSRHFVLKKDKYPRYNRERKTHIIIAVPFSPGTQINIIRHLVCCAHKKYYYYSHAWLCQLKQVVICWSLKLKKTNYFTLFITSTDFVVCPLLSAQTVNPVWCSVHMSIYLGLGIHYYFKFYHIFSSSQAKYELLNGTRY